MSTPLTVQMVAAIMPNAINNGLYREFDTLVDAARRFDINTKRRLAAWIMNVAKESGELYYTEEIADGSAYEGRTELGNVYTGDGPRYKGHGYIQITGRGNHAAVGKALGIDAIEDPLILTRQPWAWLSAAWYWKCGSAWGDLNRYADQGKYETTIVGVRGGPDEEREHYWRIAMAVLPDDVTLPAATSNGGNMAVTGQDIVASARKLLGASYRMWYSGNTVPMWLNDGQGDPPSVDWIVQNVGVMCSDLINWACEDNGLSAVGGTGAWAYAMVDWVEFDPDAPGEPGAIAVKGFTDGYYQGHIGLYTGEHSFIQSLITPGVTEDYTDAETWGWGGETQFQWYGRIPGVSYESGGDTGDPVPAVTAAWIGWNKDGLPSVNSADCSRGWRWVADLH